MSGSLQPYDTPQIEVRPLSEEDRGWAVAYFRDEVLSKLNDALFEAMEKDGWNRRHVARVACMSESNLSHALSGRRGNLQIDTIAIIAAALKKRPELTLVDLRAHHNAALHALRYGCTSVVSGTATPTSARTGTSGTVKIQAASDE